jgi:hypothetical protein
MATANRPAKTQPKAKPGQSKQAQSKQGQAKQAPARTQAQARQAKLDAARLAIARLQGRARAVRFGLWSSAAIVAVAVAAIVIAFVVGGSPRGGTTTDTVPSAAATAIGRMSKPPWDAPTDTVAAVAAAGLPMLGEEGTVVHIHAHLDIIVNGARVPVPADIGVDDARAQISPLHSHEANGVIHIESPTKPATFTLGQFFTEWQVSLSADHIGGLTTDATHHLKVYVNGTVYQGNPAGLVLSAHDEIAIVYGPDSQHVDVPRSYHWTNGL